MTPISLSVSGFKSFKQEQYLHFSQGPGLFRLAGKNKVEPALGANGVGKSATFDALCWCLFGRTPRGLRAGGVANWDGEALCSVAFTFDLKGVSHTLTRTHDPVVLTVAVGKDDPKRIDNEWVEQNLGFGLSEFLSTVLTAQFDEPFFDLTPTEKLDVFSSALGLRLWEDAAGRAKAKASAAQEDLDKAEQKWAGHKNQWKVLNGEWVKAVDEQRGFEADRKKSLAGLRKKWESAKVAYQKADATYERFRGVEGGGRAVGEGKEQDALALPANALAAYREADRQQPLLEAEAERRREEFVRVKKGKGLCPRCGKPIDPARHRRDLATAQGDWEKAEAEKVANATLVASLAEQAKEAQEREERLEGLKKKRDDLQDHYLSLGQEVEDLEKQTNPHAERVSRLKGEKDECERRVAKWEGKVDEASKLLESYAFWAKAFKEVRLWVVDEALAELAVEVNNAAAALGLVDWEVSFDVERENKSGGVTKGFSVLVTSPSSRKPVPWESWCGGETQRLRIAGAIGLSNLIRSRRGVDLPLEIWDEPTAHLSKEGIEDLLAFFAERARDEGRQVWLVDHRSLNSGLFDGETLVVKEEDGSKILPMR